MWKERQAWVWGIRSPIGLQSDQQGQNWKLQTRDQGSLEAACSRVQSSHGSQNLLKWGGRLRTVCCWFYQKRRVRPSGNMWEFPPFIFPLDLDNLPKATVLNTVFWGLLSHLSPAQLCFPLRNDSSECCFSGLPACPRVFSLEEFVWFQHRAKYQ